MRPAVGVLIELVILSFVLAASAVVPAGLPFGVYVIVAEFLATYLVHCPAHYLVGTLAGIRFRKIRSSRSTLGRALPPRFTSIASFFPVLTLSTDRGTMRVISRSRRALMYEAGTVASVSAALVISAVATFAEPLVYAALAWVVALAYLGFDIKFSPKSGDFARARAV
jgi:hypothetical protein